MKVQLVRSRFVHAVSLSLQHLYGEGVFLITAHVGITHEVENIFVGAGGGSGEI